MTPEQKQWIAALRSGAYEQGAERLERDGKFCCLGVACNLFIPETRSKKPDSGTVRYEEKVGTAPETITNILHLYDELGAIKGTNECLTEMNDRGMTFAEIADFIEANPEKVFTNDQQ